MNAGFFSDETDLALARELDQRYGCVVYPGHVQLPEVPLGTLDPDWLKVVGELSLVVITRDRRIRRKLRERHAWKEHRVRGFVLIGPLSQRTDTSLEVLVGHWDEIMKLVLDGRPGPWMYSVTSQGLRELDL